MKGEKIIQVLLCKKKLCNQKINYFLKHKILYYFILTIKYIISYVNKMHKIIH